ncbi:MAG: shikimate kinase [Bacillota bacterium]
MRDIILIGPVGVGKSTIAKLLSQKLEMSLCSLDDIRWTYYKEIGFSNLKQNFIFFTSGVKGVYKYWKKYEAHAVKRVLESYGDCVFDFGAGHSVYEDEELFQKVKNVLEPYDNIILLLPCDDIVKSMEILNKRNKCVLNEHFLTHYSNRKLAKFIVYTNGKTEEDVSNEIIEMISK